MISIIALLIIYFVSLWFAINWILGEVPDTTLEIEDLDIKISEKRQSIERCIMAPYKHATSLCGRNISTEFHFSNTDHWLKNRDTRGKIVACRRCAFVLRSYIKTERLMIRASEKKT